MAAVTELCFLLFALINNIHAGQRFIIRKEWDSYTFHLPEEADSCLISRFVGEEKLVLWNTSDLWSNKSTVPEDLKRRLSVVSTEKISSYMIHNLTHAESGPYQEECWTEGKVTHEKNISVIICSSVKNIHTVPVTYRETVLLQCLGTADNQDVQWLWQHKNEDEWTRVFEDNTTSVIDNVGGRFQVVKDKSNILASNFQTTVVTVFTCLVMKQQQCVSSHPAIYGLTTELIYGSVGETAVLPCTVADVSDDQPPHWSKSPSNADLVKLNKTVDQNYSLAFSLLTLNHSGHYYCETSMKKKIYFLLVCPKFGPPAVELFSLREEVTLRCKNLVKGIGFSWFIKSNQTEGRIIVIETNLTMSRVTEYPDRSLVISNLSLKDAGEYWCAIIDQDQQCVLTTKTVLKYREPFGVHSTFYKVRCSVLSALLVILCAAVVAVNRRTRRGGQLPAQTHS